MASQGTVLSGQVWAMLDECAPGHTRTLTKHNVRIAFRGETYYRFPAGPHGKKRGGNKYRVEIGHVKNLVRLFQIRECARNHFEKL